MTNPEDGARGKLPGTIKIIGIGQSLRGDDAAGLAAVNLWQEKYLASSGRPNLQVELVELPGVDLLSLLEGCSHAILVDAVRSTNKPGTVQSLTLDQLEAYRDGAGSAHGWGVAETLLLGCRLMPELMPQKLVLVTIEAGDISLGEELSPAVERAIPQAACLIEELIRR